MRDAFEWELRARLRELEHERADEAQLLGLPETGDFPVLVECCATHGRYIPVGHDRDCPTCDLEHRSHSGYRNVPWSDR